MGQSLGADVGTYYGEPVEGMSVDALAAVTAWEDRDSASLFSQAIQVARLMRTVECTKAKTRGGECLQVEVAA